MSVYIAMLRGINVSGQKLIKMADLREAFVTQKFTDVQTYIQSGNIVFSSTEQSIETLEAKIHACIFERFGFDVPTLVRTAPYFEKAIAENPFSQDKSKDVNRCYITFLKAAPLAEKVEALLAIDYLPEEIRIQDQVAYLYSPENYGRSKVSNNLIEAKLNVSATTRNWKTTLKLLDIARA